jgi:hypothetical protein
MKTQIIRISLFTAVFSFLGVQLNAQHNNEPSSSESKVETPAMNMSRNAATPVPVPVQNLMKFVGRWEADATLSSEGKTVQVNYWVDCKSTADGNGIFADEGFTSPEMGTLSGADLAGFDPFDGKVKWFSVDNMGTAHEHKGEWLTPDHLVIQFDGLRDGKKYVEKIDFTFKGNDALDFKLVGTLDGLEVEKGSGLFHKK